MLDPSATRAAPGGAPWLPHSQRSAIEARRTLCPCGLPAVLPYFDAVSFYHFVAGFPDPGIGSRTACRLRSNSSNFPRQLPLTLAEYNQSGEARATGPPPFFPGGEWVRSSRCKRTV